MSMQKTGPRPSDRFIPWYFVAFFVGLTLILGVFTWVAVHGYSGLVAVHAYEDGVAYNKILRTATAQQALGWHAVFDVIPTTDTNVDVVYTLQDADGRAIDDAQVKIIFKRPTMSKFDQTVVLQHRTNGHYTATLDLSVHGVWDVYGVAMVQGHEFQTLRRVVMP
ncbi:MAG: FixH family protein [Hyphomicrobium sp.]